MTLKIQTKTIKTTFLYEISLRNKFISSETFLYKVFNTFYDVNAKTSYVRNTYVTGELSLIYNDVTSTLRALVE